MAPFAGIKELPPDPLFGLKARYNADSRTNKVDLGIGAYRDNNGNHGFCQLLDKQNRN